MAYFNRNTTENSIKSSIRSRVGDVAFAKKEENKKRATTTSTRKCRGY